MRVSGDGQQQGGGISFDGVQRRILAICVANTVLFFVVLVLFFSGIFTTKWGILLVTQLNEASNVSNGLLLLLFRTPVHNSSHRCSNHIGVEGRRSYGSVAAALLRTTPVVIPYKIFSIP